VFLSHTSDLRTHPSDRSFVAAAEAAVTRAGHVAIDMAYFGARDVSPADHSARMVSESDVYVGIIGCRHGTSIRDQPSTSYTELEFDIATELRLPRLVFLVSTERESKQEAFVSKLLEAEVTVARTTSVAELELMVYQGLVELMLDQAAFRPNIEMQHRHRVVSCGPTVERSCVSKRRKIGVQRL
jgi:hypothetical protein